MINRLIAIKRFTDSPIIPFGHQYVTDSPIHRFTGVSLREATKYAPNLVLLAQWQHRRGWLGIFRRLLR